MTRILATALFIVMTLMAVAACSGSSGSAAPSAATSPAPAAPAGGATAVTIKDLAFTPATTSVPTGSKVTWTNNDTTAHTVTFDDGRLIAGTSPLVRPSITASRPPAHSRTTARSTPR
jgi:plastocyanin